MAKAVSTLVSITLLVVAHRAAQYWHRTHARVEMAQLNARWAEAYADSTTPQIIPTNITLETCASLIPLQP
ncbi:MAG TPA: hypothetical protein VG754_07785 [Verrucomicrobiae bacterium]|nr:hypothetical protein [Verrucomicrobiae bacterium]